MGKKTVAVIAALVVVLLVSNGWWAYRLLDAGVSYTYQQDSLRMNQEALSQTLELLGRLISQPSASREQLIAAAAGASHSDTQPFEKEGLVWVGSIGLEFSDAGRLVEVQRAWSPP